MGLQEKLKPIILCADDYGVTAAVGKGIRQLVGLRRLSAVSCMSTAPDWSSEAALLQPLCDEIDVGLHFNLTQGFGQAVPGLAVWLVNSLTGRIDQAQVKRELLRQLERFESVWGGPPDFIDGHQHVHIFPAIRQVLFQVLTERYPKTQRPWVRRVNPPLTGHDALTKALLLNLLSVGFLRQANHWEIELTPGFTGLYSLSETADYPAMMDGWLRRAKPGTLLMCHPSSSAEPDFEGIGQARLREFHYLRGVQFGALCEEEGIGLARLRHQ